MDLLLKRMKEGEEEEQAVVVEEKEEDVAWRLFVSLACHTAGLLYSSRFTHHEAEGSNMTRSTLHRTTCQHWGSICEGKEMTETVWYKRVT